jgi:hypothetical protein
MTSQTHLEVRPALVISERRDAKLGNLARPQVRCRWRSNTEVVSDLKVRNKREIDVSAIEEALKNTRKVENLTRDSQQRATSEGHESKVATKEEGVVVLKEE